MNTDTAQAILFWYIRLSEPNPSRAYYECPVCHATWHKDGLFGVERHNLDCWIPMLQGEVKSATSWKTLISCRVCNGQGFIVYDGDKKAKCIECDGTGNVLK